MATPDPQLGYGLFFFWPSVYFQPGFLSIFLIEHNRRGLLSD
jgi:hypothetical protein